MFSAAEQLGVPPWSLAGFTYENVAHMPICWREWALEYRSACAAVRTEAMKA